MIRLLFRYLLGFRGMTRDEARDWAAILYTPVLTLCAVGQTIVMVWGGWPAETAAQRLNFLGWTLIGNLCLIGLGTFFLQRRTVNMKADLPGGGSVEFENVTAPDTSKATLGE